MVPEIVQVKFLDLREPENHPVVDLSRCIIDLAEQSLDSNMREAIFSPRLMEAVVWFFSRWTGTYLMPLDAGREPYCMPGQEGERHPETQLGRSGLLKVFGEEKQGKVLLGTLVRIAIMTLTLWPGE